MKWASNKVLDGFFTEIKKCTRMVLVENFTEDYNDATSKALAIANIDLTQVNPSTGGNGKERFIPIPAQNNLDIKETGTVSSALLLNGSEVVFSTSVTSQQLVKGNTVTVPAWSIWIAKPN